LYAGNLDAYQAAEQTLAALEQLALSSGPRVTMLLATNSQPERFLARAVQLGVPFRSYALGDEPIRRLLHAAADLAIVPRATPGGLPMKLLDALARGTPCALAPLAAAGLALQGVTEQATAPGHKALADSIARLTHRLGHPEQRRALADRARAYVANEHRPERFHAALDKVIAQAKRDHRSASGSVRSVNVHDGSHRSNNIHTPSSAAAPKHVRSHFVSSHDE
jgi:glycosyltransferase involved in cell wall biosynthesis